MKKTKRGNTSLKESIRNFLSSKNYKPVSREELYYRLQISKAKHRHADKIVGSLLKEGFVKLDGKLLVRGREKKRSQQGVIRMHPRGFGFVTPKESKALDKDVFIPRHLTMNAVDGDIVEVHITGEHETKGPEGEVLSILQRGRKNLAGTIVEDREDGYFYAYVPILGMMKDVLVEGNDFELGDRYQLEVTKWGGDEEPTYCVAKKKLGSIDDAKVDVKCAVYEYELRDQFSKEAVAEAKKYGKEVGDACDRADFRDVETFTIDPVDAKDYDDALSLTVEKNGDMTLLVHIADVSHYVKPGSALDKEAYARCNSTYFPGQCIPMLPTELSNELCSLKAKVDRFAVTVEMHFNKNGDLLNYGIDKSIIHSQKRFTYEEAKEVLDGKKKSKHKKTLEQMVDLCLKLKEKRISRGSVDLAMPEVRLVIGKDGIPTGYETVDYDITHQLVEEFMLKANEVVAHQLLDMGVGAVFRVHEEPDAKDFEEFYKVVQSLGFVLPKNPEQEDICKLFMQAQNSPELQKLSIAFIRSMKLAIYSERNIGHYGLGLEHYCHFTSPIRRYSDLVVHRLLFDEEGGDLSAIALRCSEKERMSWRAEQSVRTLKKLRYIEELYDKEPERTYELEISKVKHYGIHCVWNPIGIEGMVLVGNLGKDYYEFNPRAGEFRGRKSGHTFRVGGKVKGKIDNIDLVYQDMTWRII